MSSISLLTYANNLTTLELMWSMDGISPDYIETFPITAGATIVTELNVKSPFLSCGLIITASPTTVRQSAIFFSKLISTGSGGAGSGNPYAYVSNQSQLQNIVRDVSELVTTPFTFAELSDFTAADGVITYTGADTRMFHVTIAFVHDTESSDGRKYEMRKNDVQVNVNMEVDNANNDNRFSSVMINILPMSTGDYLGLWVRLFQGSNQENKMDGTMWTITTV